MFTNNFVTGGTIRPDVRFLAVHTDNTLADIKEGSIIYNRATILDYIPVASIGSGLCKVLFGLIHLVAYVARRIFDSANSSLYSQEISLAAKNIFRGLVAIVPIIGNLALLFFDLKRIKANIDASAKFEQGFAILYAGGKEIGRKTSTEYYQRIKDHDLSAAELLRFMRSDSSIEDSPVGGVYQHKRSLFAMRGKSSEADGRIISIYRGGGTYMDVALAV